MRLCLSLCLGLALLHSVEVLGGTVIRHVETLPMWWDFETHFHDTNKKSDYALAWDGKINTKTKDVYFRRRGGMEISHTTPIATAFKLDTGYTGMIRLVYDLKASVSEVKGAELSGIGSYDIEVWCAEVDIVKGDEGSIMGFKKGEKSILLYSDMFDIEDINSSGEMNSATFEVNGCSGLVIKESSTIGVSVSGGAMIRPTVYRSIREIMFLSDKRELDFNHFLGN